MFFSDSFRHSAIMTVLWPAVWIMPRFWCSMMQPLASSANFSFRMSNSVFFFSSASRFLLYAISFFISVSSFRMLPISFFCSCISANMGGMTIFMFQSITSPVFISTSTATG